MRWPRGTWQWWAIEVIRWGLVALFSVALVGAIIAVMQFIYMWNTGAFVPNG